MCGAQHEECHFSIRPQDFGSPTARPLYHFAVAQTRAIDLTHRTKLLCRIPAGPSLPMVRSILLFALIACAIALAWHRLGPAGRLPPSPLGQGEKLTCLSYAPFHGEQAPFTGICAFPTGRSRTICGGSPKLTPCVRTYSAAGPKGRSPGSPTALGLQGAARHLARAESRREPAGDRGGAEARPAHPGTVAGHHRRQRGSAPRRARSRQDQGLSRRGKAALGASGHLCRCLGVLAEGARARAVRRLRHHPYPALLGGPAGQAEDAVEHVREVRDRLVKQPSPARRS